MLFVVVVVVDDDVWSRKFSFFFLVPSGSDIQFFSQTSDHISNVYDLKESN